MTEKLLLGQTRISTAGAEGTVIRGYDLDELIGGITYSQAVFLTIIGRMPSPAETRMFDGIFVSLIDYGVSTVALLGRIIAACGGPVQTILAGAALSIADQHGGVSQEAANELSRLVEEALRSSDPFDVSLSATAARMVRIYREKGRRIAGLGHPSGVRADTRAERLFALADELGVSGTHVAAIRRLAAAAQAETGRDLVINLNGALAAVSLDLGMPATVIRGLVIIARSGGLLAHVVEETETGFPTRRLADQLDFTYVGEMGRTLGREEYDESTDKPR